MVDFRNYINPQPHGKFTADWQRAFLPDGESYVEDKTGNVIDALIHSVRHSSIVRVRRLFCLAPWVGTPRKRRLELARRVDAIKERGGAILEAETQRRTDVRGNTAQMLMGAYDDISTGGRSISHGKMGRPGAEYTKEQTDAMRQIWFSRRYKTREQATAAVHSLGIKISRTRLYGLFGLPNRDAATADEVVNHVPELPPKLRRLAMAATDQEHGEELGLRFLRMCQDDGATGTALLNAMGNALVGFFMTADFDNHQERMAEVDKWCAELKKEIGEAHIRTASLRKRQRASPT